MEDGHGPPFPAGFPYWSVSGPQIAGLFRMYLSGSYRKPDRKNTSPKPRALTPAMPRLLRPDLYLDDACVGQRRREGFKLTDHDVKLL